MVYEEQALLTSGLNQLGLTVASEDTARLMTYLHYLQKWNRQYNLTAISDLDRMIAYHVLDSLAVAPYIQGKTILDIGSGAGFPGIPLAVYYPEKQFVLLDSNGKKTRFLTQAVAHIGLHNVTVVQARVEHWQPAETLLPFDMMIARAVSNIKALIAKTQHLAAPQTRWCFLKGTYPTEEIKAITLPIEIQALQVPGIEGERHVVLVRQHV